MHTCLYDGATLLSSIVANRAPVTHTFPYFVNHCLDLLALAPIITNDETPQQSSE